MASSLILDKSSQNDNKEHLGRHIQEDYKNRKLKLLITSL